MAARRSQTAPADLERSAAAAYLAGREDECVDLLTRAHSAAVDAGDRRTAARAAFWLAFQFVGAGDHAQASGWIGRARRLLDEHKEMCVECGYVLLPQAMAVIGRGDFRRAEEMFGESEQIGLRFHDTDLVAFARHGRGRVLIATGR